MFNKIVRDHTIPPKPDNDRNPSYYANMPVQPISVMRSILTPNEFIGYLKGNIIKYAMRAGKKENTDDKAKFETYKKWLHKELQNNKD